MSYHFVLDLNDCELQHKESWKIYANIWMQFKVWYAEPSRYAVQQKVSVLFVIINKCYITFYIDFRYYAANYNS